jgi:hypothetical protein
MGIRAFRFMALKRQDNAVAQVAGSWRPTADEIEPLDRTDRHWVIDPADAVPF